ncbi:hypothetical protein AC623_14160 [Bacillus sp. FJAT-27231]|uniref:hypothetical protein n=1 Tax=Bacillus sp. FJAT-27231 TaxID=1679168 RepID=UPI000671584B|nr:hypothetical protein [Bacillus sp. FJAT-27231]KMY54936.1 hypothetical protein AC623_14160 [Bacillus sp. FJAT-27231]
MWREVIVLVSKDTQVIFNEIGNLMSQYDFTTPVEPYIDNCYCLDNDTIKKEAKEIANEKVAHIDDLYKKYAELDEKELTSWGNFISDWKNEYESACKSHPLYNKADPECLDCKGRGVYISKYNPRGKFDIWDIGYGWQGKVRTIHIDENDEGYIGNDDMVYVRDISEKYIENNTISDVLTPDGEWHEWDWTDDIKMHGREWTKKVKKIIEDYNDCIAVKCKIHF